MSRVGSVVNVRRNFLVIQNSSETLNETIVARALRTARWSEVYMAAQWRPLLNGQFGEWDPR